jgi:hypothetical protein
MNRFTAIVFTFIAIIAIARGYYCNEGKLMKLIRGGGRN